MSSATPYTISIPDSSIDLLKQKLALTRLPDELAGSEWDLGAPLEDVKRLAAKWQNDFDWRAVEAELNKFPQFKTPINVDRFGDVGIHFIHQQSSNSRAPPLLFVHGWPGHYLEVRKLLPLLKDHFTIVAPSLPNFGFSDGIKKRGFGIGKYAEVCHKLMLSLGYDQYVTQGGDWGSYITRAIGVLYPTHCLASHLNMVHGLPPTFLANPLLAIQHRLTPYTQAEKGFLARRQQFVKEGRGYYTEQATKPQTIGYALADSPVAVLSWIYEKLHDWSDSYPWTDDEVLEWISIYWFSTAGPGASVRIYYEHEHPSDPRVSMRNLLKWNPGVKLGYGFFPKEIVNVPKTWARTRGPVVFEADHAKGGHFAAYEVPEEVASDLIKMFGKGGPCYGIIKSSARL